VPRVSVIVPSYNHAQYIEEAVDSVLNDQIGDLELIVIDDGSADASVEILSRYADDPRVTIQSQANQGAHAALNRGLALASGEYMMILNSDDAYGHGRVSRCVDLLDRSPEMSMACTWIQVIDRHGADLGIKQAYRNMPPWPLPGAGPYLSDTDEPSFAILEANFVATTSNIAFRRSLVRDHGASFHPLRYAHDWDFILGAMAHGDLAVIEEPLVRYRVHETNTIREGQQADQGQGLMRFEVLWVVAKHLEQMCERWVRRGRDRQDFMRRVASSLPDFGCPSLRAQLIQLRGSSTDAPPAYVDLLRPEHPYRVAAIQALS
jgi:glycosyltransferase involved in cell wall biosynthesis